MTEYSHKHYESRFTKFCEGYWLIKNHFDKRKAHYSSLILSNQMSRDEALERLGDPIDKAETQKDLEFVAKNSTSLLMNWIVISIQRI